MYKNIQKRGLVRKKRVLRVRQTLRGTSEKPRLCVFKSNQNLFVQVIDDEKGLTLASFGTYSKKGQGKKEGSKKSKESAKKIGLAIGELAKKNSIEKVVFDRGRFKFHGAIAEIANGAREAGLQF